MLQEYSFSSRKMTKKNRNRNRMSAASCSRNQEIDKSSTTGTGTGAKVRTKQRKVRVVEENSAKNDLPWDNQEAPKKVIVKKVRFSNIVTSFPSPEEEMRNCKDNRKRRLSSSLPLPFKTSSGGEMKSILKPSSAPPPKSDSSSSIVSFGFFSRLFGSFW